MVIRNCYGSVMFDNSTFVHVQWAAVENVLHYPSTYNGSNFFLQVFNMLIKIKSLHLFL